MSVPILSWGAPTNLLSPVIKTRRHFHVVIPICIPCSCGLEIFSIIINSIILTWTSASRQRFPRWKLHIMPRALDFISFPSRPIVATIIACRPGREPSRPRFSFIKRYTCFPRPSTVPYLFMRKLGLLFQIPFRIVFPSTSAHIIKAETQIHYQNQYNL